MNDLEKIYLNEVPILVSELKEEKINGLNKLSIVFPVTSKEYHDITVLLYKQEFNVFIPTSNITFYGKIVQFYTTITDLYKEGNIGEFTLSLLEIDGE